MIDAPEKPRRGRPTTWGEKQKQTMINLPSGLRKIADAECARYGCSLSELFRRVLFQHAFFYNEEVEALLREKLPPDEGEGQMIARSLSGGHMARRIAERFPTLTYEEALVVVLGYRHADETMRWHAAVAEIVAADALAAEQAAIAGTEEEPMTETA